MNYKIPDPPSPSNYPLVSPRGAKLATRIWPVSKPRALVLLTHSGGWHSGYFEQLAQRLNQDNLFVAAYDRVCMGYSDPEPRAPTGYVHIHEFDDYVEDLWEAVRWAQLEVGDVVGREAASELPIFLLGESLGGLEVLSAGLDKYSSERVSLAGVVILGAALQVNPSLLPPNCVIRLLSFLAPYYPRVKMPGIDMSASFDENFGDKKWAEIARSDSAVQVSPRSTLAFAVSMAATGDGIAELASDWHLPLLAVHAFDDCKAQFEAVHKFVDQVGPARAEGFWISGTTGHQLLQDRAEVTKRVMDKVASWITSKL
jgi:alpha-beta hydrolase superfamily lysophospholipase